jgi:hypothetical protein
MRAMQAWLMRSVSRQEGHELMRELYRRAMGGDVAAAKVVLERIAGKPKRWEDIPGEGQAPPQLAVVFVDQVPAGRQVRLEPYLDARGPDVVAGAVEQVLTGPPEPPDAAS